VHRGQGALRDRALVRFLTSWLAISAAFSAVAVVVDLLHRFDLLGVIALNVAIGFSTMLLVEAPVDPVIELEAQNTVVGADSWASAVVRLVFLREIIQRTLTYPTRADRALRDLVIQLATFRASGGRGFVGTDRGSDLPKELSYETRALLDGTAPASLDSLRSVVKELEDR
jgi:hypothetical protein